MTFPHVKFASASFCICFFQCHLPLLFYHQWRDVCAIADYARRRLLKRRRSLLQALDWWGLRGPCTAIFTIYIYIYIYSPIQLEIIVCCLRLALSWFRSSVVNWSSVILKLITPQEVIVVHQPLDGISILIAWHLYIYIYMDII